MLEVKELAVTYPGGIKALDGVSYSVNEQEILRLLGPNGAGKTALVTVLITLPGNAALFVYAGCLTGACLFPLKKMAAVIIEKQI